MLSDPRQINGTCKKPILDADCFEIGGAVMVSSLPRGDEPQMW
jgi:hypothetical protein